MSQHHHHNQPVPRGVLLGAGAIMAFSILVAAGARQINLAHPAPAAPPPLERVAVTFEDREDGAIVIRSAASQQVVNVVPPRSGGFIRGVLRGMMRTRKLESVDRGAAFLLSREASGRLAIEDPKTGRRVDLDSFGPTNSEAFASVLAAGMRPGVP